MDDVRKAKDFRGVPNHFEIPEFCARCHSNPQYMHDRDPRLPVDQLDKYKTSVHGQRLYKDKDKKVATCVSCHTAHSIGDPKMPHSTTYPQNLPGVCSGCHSNKEYMAEYNIPTDQYAKYVKSVHGIALLKNNDLSAPACNDCHGNHGAAPPGIAHLSMVCGQCHAIEAGLFTESPHYTAFEENDFPMCETCHNHHDIVKPTDALVSLEDPGICGECHDPEEDTSAPAAVDTIQQSLKRLVLYTDSATAVLNEAHTKGMMTTDDEFLLKDAHQALISARTSIHAFNPDSVTTVAAKGDSTALKVLANAEALIGEYYFRRIGFLIATFIITILAIALYLKIRRMEKANPGGRSSTLKPTD